MKKIGLICLMLCAVITIQCFAAPVFAEGEMQNSTITNGSHSLNARIPLLGSDQLVGNTQSAVLFEASSETLMYAWNADEQMSPASLVKILTALITVEQGSLSDAVTVTETVLNTVPYDAVTADLLAGEVLTVEDLLYCMMVGSANDAAAVLAAHLFGSQAAFVAEMNRYAQALGCTGTNFTNVHGLHDENQFTTARDVTRILAAAVQNEKFCAVFEAVRYTVPATNKSDARELITGNYLMNQNQDSVEIYYDSRVTGGRTGVTSSGHRCIAVTAESNGMLLISVVMGAKSVYQEDGYTVQSFGGYKETSALLDAGFEGHTATQIIYKGQALAQYMVENGASDVVVGAKESVSTVLPQGVTTSELIYRYSNPGGFQAPVERGQILSKLEVWYASTCIAQVDLYAMNSVPIQQEQSVKTGDENDDISWPLVLTVVVCIAVGALILAIIIRTVGRLRLAAARSRSRRHRRNRRRSR